MEQLVILLVVGAIGLVKWLLEKSAEQRSRRETEERIGRFGESEPAAHPMPAPRPAASFPLPDPDSAARRLREALGLPDESDLPRRRPPVVASPPSFRMDQIKVVPVADPERRIVKTEPAAPSARTPPPSFPHLSPEPVAAPRSNLDDLLRSRDGLRKAILVQEILGTPKGLVF